MLILAFTLTCLISYKSKHWIENVQRNRDTNNKLVFLPEIPGCLYRQKKQPL